MPEWTSSQRKARPQILLVGCGKMGSALLTGWLSRDEIGHVTIIEPEPGPAIPRDDVRVTLLAAPDPGLSADIIVLAVKPQKMADMAGYAPLLGQGASLLSIAAGKTLARFAALFGADAAVIRAMPNTPAAIGRGISVAIANARVRDDQIALADRLLQAVGAVEWVADEALLDPVTALSGSGPAYVFLLVEAMAAAGVKAGLPDDLAMRLARATVIGSGALLGAVPDSAAELRRNVTSPNGTTAAALAVLMAPDGLQAIFDRALAAASARSRELAQ